MKVTGGCHCGALKFSAEVDPTRVAVCHCTDCQIMSGTAFRTVVQVAAGDFELLEGTPKFYDKTGDSGNRRTIAFCDTCSSQIYATNAEPPQDVYGIRVGTIDQRDKLVPRVQVWCQSKLGWLDELEELPALERQ